MSQAIVVFQLLKLSWFCHTLNKLHGRQRVFAFSLWKQWLSLLEGICIMKSDVSNCSLFQELLLNTGNHP